MYTVKEASLILGLSIPAIKKQIYNGKLKAEKTKGYRNKTTWLVSLPESQIQHLVLNWLEDMKQGNGYKKPFSPKTIASRRWYMSDFWKYSQRTPSLLWFTPSTLKEVFENLNQSNRCRFSTKEGILKAYRSFANWLIKKELGTKALLEGISELKPKRFTPPKRSKLKPHEMAVLLDTIEGYNSTAYHKERLKLLVLLISTTGLRIAEALSLELQDLDFENGCLKVIGKGQKPRITVLPKVLNQALQVWIQTHQKGESLLNDWSYSGALNALRRALKPTGLDIRFHGLRRTCATYWVEQGTPITMVSKLLGHSCIKTTQLYVEADALDAVRYVNALPQLHYDVS
jgi:integrase